MRLSLILLLFLLTNCAVNVADYELDGVEGKVAKRVRSEIQTRYNVRPPSESGRIAYGSWSSERPKNIEDLQEMRRSGKRNSFRSSRERNYESVDLDQDFGDVDRSYYDPSYSGRRYTGYYKVGKPYEIFGIKYYPRKYNHYEEEGVASWYGDEFHGKKTANGEIYNMRDMTAAHKTLPLPSLVRVTNLRNGRNVVVRVNDRGPFAKNRIIDVSQKVAETLGFRNQGTQEVRVELLRKETDAMLRRLNLI